ncbi:MAG: hypothetical protein QXV09_01825 [Candidatus Bathyarchaeia archaeon]
MYEDDIEFRVGRSISLFLSLLGLPGETSSPIFMDAQKVAQAIINQQRQHKNEIKLTVQEIAALALWRTISERQLPIPLKEFEKKLRPSFTKRLRLFKIMKRVTWLEILDGVSQSSPANYIPSITRKADENVEHKYLSVVETYALKMVASPESS